MDGEISADDDDDVEGEGGAEMVEGLSVVFSRRAGQSRRRPDRMVRALDHRFSWWLARLLALGVGGESVVWVGLSSARQQEMSGLGLNRLLDARFEGSIMESEAEKSEATDIFFFFTFLWLFFVFFNFNDSIDFSLIYF